MPSNNEDMNLAIFCDFENIALGVRDAKMKKFDISLILERLLVKGTVVFKKAYCDWERYKQFKPIMHDAAFELIEIPHTRQSGKNSADIRMVVDALDLCYTKEHLETFVILSGDSDFSPLVSKLRENNKSVIGMGVRKSTSDLLVESCDEFIFYDDLGRRGTARPALEALPPDKAEVFKFLISTVEALIRENKEILYSSLIKDAMKRKQPSFTEQTFGYSTFGDLLEDAKQHGVVEITRDPKAGGTYIVTRLGSESKKK